jgi:hypothetical protein
MAKLPSESPGKLELYPDAWDRFERAVDAAVKSGPKHKIGKRKAKASQEAPKKIGLVSRD